MIDLAQLAQYSALVAGASSLLYALTITTTALTAILSRTPSRSRAAREVLKLLLRRRDT